MHVVFRYCLIVSCLWCTALGNSLGAQDQTATIPAPTIPTDTRPATSSAAAVEPDGIPPARTKYLGRTIAQTMSFHGAPWLIRDNREEEERPSQVLKQLDLKPGMVVCDLGCGNGFYTLLMAQQVAPHGKVLAVDIQQEMLHLLKLRSESEGLDNIEPILGTIIDPHLPAASVDLILLVDVYHEFSHPEQMLAALRQSLAPGGQIALLEYREEDRSVPIKPLHKMSKRQIMKEYRANGFKLAKQFDGLPWQHMMFFEVDPNWNPAVTSQAQDE
jgi:ubiquinone/menaquinone biosynthesis C-methylase UbiE